MSEFRMGDIVRLESGRTAEVTYPHPEENPNLIQVKILTVPHDGFGNTLRGTIGEVINAHRSNVTRLVPQEGKDEAEPDKLEARARADEDNLRDFIHKMGIRMRTGRTAGKRDYRKVVPDEMRVMAAQGIIRNLQNAANGMGLYHLTDAANYLMMLRNLGGRGTGIPELDNELQAMRHNSPVTKRLEAEVQMLANVVAEYRNGAQAAEKEYDRLSTAQRKLVRDKQIGEA